MTARSLWLVAVAALLVACGTALVIEPDGANVGPSDGGPGSESGAAGSEGGALGDALAGDGPSEACASPADCDASSGCAAGERACGTTGGVGCIDVQSDDQNCGSCGHVCNIPGTCVMGDCTRIVFVTSSAYPISAGTFHGLDDADAICQGLAVGQRLQNTFRAWLSDSAHYPADGTRFTKSTQPYVLRTGTPIATSFANLTSGMLLVPISIDQGGLAIAGDFVWTGTLANGQKALTGHCTSWMDNSTPGTNAYAGDMNAKTQAWTEQSLPCSGSGHLYCFEQ